MRLGDRLQVKTSKAGERRWNLLDIDWSLFGHDSQLRVEDIQIDPVVGEEKHQRDESGTTIRISGLRSDWDSVTFSDMLRSEEHTSELQSLMRISYAVFCLKKKTKYTQHTTHKIIIST